MQVQRGVVDDGPGKRMRLHGLRNLKQDLSYLRQGILDWRSLFNAFRRRDNPVEWIVWRDGQVAARRYSHNLRTNLGGDLYSRLLGGDLANGDAGTSTSVTATTIVDTTKAWPTNGYAGHLVYSGGVGAVVLSNTATTLTFTRWFNPATPGGTAGTTPSIGSYVITTESYPFCWMAVSADATAPAVGDTTLAAEITTNGLGRAYAAYSHIVVTGSGAATIAGTYTLTALLFSTGTTSGVQKAAVFNDKVAGIMVLENTITPVTLNPGDVLQINWVVTY